MARALGAARPRARGQGRKASALTALSRARVCHAALDASLEGSRQEHYLDKHGWHRDRNVQVKDSKAFATINVSTIDAAPFLAHLVAASEFVAVKLDIEGHEYEVVRHVLLSQPRALCDLDILAVEWHEGGFTASAGLPGNSTGVLKWLLEDSSCKVHLFQWF